MGEIIAFRNEERLRSDCRQEEPRRFSPAPPEGTAQILFFLGVRYSRPEEDPDGRPKRANQRQGLRAARSRRKKQA